MSDKYRYLVTVEVENVSELSQITKEISKIKGFVNYEMMYGSYQFYNKMKELEANEQK